MFLAEKGVEMDYVQIDLQKGENLTPEFKQKNPMGKVPVLELDDGTCIAESMAICRYFEEIKPEPLLMGRTPVERAQVEMWQRWLEMYFLLPTGMCFQHSSGYFKDRMNPIKEWGDDCGKAAAQFFTRLDAHLAGKEFVLGDYFSVADITAFCTIDFNKIINVRILPEQTNLQAWYQRIKSRPSATA
jgi:glutathione S-transferase